MSEPTTKASDRNFHPYQLGNVTNENTMISPANCVEKEVNSTAIRNLFYGNVDNKSELLNKLLSIMN